MAESPTGVIPEELMHAERREDVIRFLVAAHLPATYKRELYIGWSVTVGAATRREDYERIERSGG